MSYEKKEQAVGFTLPPEGGRVDEYAKRSGIRRFSRGYKLKILEECDSASYPGQVGAILRREGLYASYLNKWRIEQKRQRDKGLPSVLTTTEDKNPLLDVQGTPSQGNPNHLSYAQLLQENRKLRQQLLESEVVIEIQKKVSTHLGIASETYYEPRFFPTPKKS